MTILRRPLIALTIRYSALFFVCIWSLSAGIYYWVDGSLGTGYVNRVNDALERQAKRPIEISDDQAVSVADVTIDQLRNILLIVNSIALVGVPLGAYLIARRTLRSFEEASTLQRHFAANVSHELRTPLAVAGAEAEWALKRPRSSDEYQKSFSSVQRQVSAMSATISRLLSVTVAGRESISLDDVPLQTLVESTIAGVSGLADSRKVQIIQSVGYDTVIADPGLLSIAVRNILDNAVRYAKPQTSVAVDSYSTGNHVILTVSNTSRRPVSRNDLSQITKGEFHRHSAPGHGYGLPLSAQIIRVLGGSIRVSVKGMVVTMSVRLDKA